MATGRTVKRFTRVYIDGYDMSGYTREIGPLTWEYPEVEQVALLDAVKGALLDIPNINIGTLNGVFDNTATSGIHAVLGTAGVARNAMVPIGIQADPAAGDIVFVANVNESGYQIAPSGGDIVLTAPFTSTPPTSSMLYEKPWGVLLHALSAGTGANTGTGIDNGAATTAGGFLMYQITAVAGTGTATISIDDSANNSTWLALSGATSGAIAHTAMPCAGIVQLSKTATVRKYLRWQLALTGITSVTFALAFVRG